MKIQGQGKKPAINTSSGGSFAITAPGYYTATVVDVKLSFFGDGWLKYTPRFRLHNDVSTFISHNDIIGGLWDGAKFIQNPKHPDKPVMSDAFRHFLSALGVFDEGEEESLIKNRIIKVKTGIAGYIKGGRNFYAWELKELLGNPDFDELKETLAAHNEEFGVKIQPKNVILGTYPHNDYSVKWEEHEFGQYATDFGWIRLENGQTFLSEGDYEDYLNDVEAGF